ncbi:MAG TPA: mandelate racemase/muconate lactonizing enzyme family protein [Bacillota bacterium]|nr:mandelate racemase/muconate lactonizing enzyme family protein [Bacillota bacterium]
MIIEKIDTYPLLYRLKNPYGDANGYKKYRSCFMIRITTASGIEGWGECIDWLPTLVDGFKHRLIPYLIGKKVTSHTQLVTTIGKWHQRSAAAISMALTEILAKQSKLSVCEWWGGILHHHIPVYASFQSYTDQEKWINHSLDLVEGVIHEGYPMVKVKVGGKKLQEDQAHIQALQARIGHQVGIAIDANQSYDVATAVQWERQFQNWSNILWLEEPLPMDHLSDYKTLRSTLSVPLAGGENLIKPIQFLTLLADGALDIIQPDVMHMAGLGAFRDTAKLSRYYGIRCSPHCFDGFLSRLYALFTQATLGQWSKMEGENIEPIEWDVMDNPFTTLIPLRPQNGVVTIPEGIGIGVEIDQEKMKAYLWDGSRYW